MTIYIDIIFLENVIMNYIILYATSIILKLEINYLKLILASVIGSIYVVIEYISKINLYSNFILKTFLSIIIVFIAFNPQNVKKMLKELLIFYLTTFTFGGIATYLIYVVKPQNAIVKNGMYVGTYVLKIIFIGAILGTFLLIISFRVVRNKMRKRDMICKTRIKLNGKEIILNTMIDTGNLLKEPLTGNSVIVVERSSLIDILPISILNNLDEILSGNFEKLPDKIKNEYVSRLKIIPFSSLGKQNGMLIGIKPESVEVITEDLIEKRKDAIVGIYGKSLTKRGEYNAIIGIE